MLTDKDIMWPEGASWNDMASKIAACLKQSPSLGPLVTDPKWRIHNYMARLCLEYGLHPKWLMVTLQRERSLLKLLGTDKDFDRACGFVGSDDPGTINPSWDGLSNQIWRCVRHSSWYAGLAPRMCFGYEPSLWPTAKRWEPASGPQPVPIQGLADPHFCETRAEFMQLVYTDHLEVLAQNAQILQEFVQPYF